MVRTMWGAATLALLATFAACAVEPAEAPDASDAVEPQQLGTLERTAIDETIRSHMNPIRSCYQRVLVQDPSVAGEIRVKFVIGADGAVTSAAVESSTLPDEVGDCILSAFDRMVFPEPEGGGIVIVTYPFVFELG